MGHSNARTAVAPFPVNVVVVIVGRTPELAQSVDDCTSIKCLAHVVEREMTGLRHSWLPEVRTSFGDHAHHGRVRRNRFWNDIKSKIQIYLNYSHNLVR